MLELVVLLAAVTALVAINGLYVAAEFAIVSVRPTRLTKLAEEGHGVAAAIAEIVRDPDQLSRYFATTQLGITAASIGLGMYGEHALADRIEPLLAGLGPWAAEASHVASTGIAVIVLTFLHVVLGEMVPKSIALRHPETSVLRLAAPMRISRALLAPLVVVLSRLGAVVLRILRVPPADAAGRILNAEELAMLIGESTRGGLIEQRESQILLSIFDFGEREVHQVMTPRTRIVAFSVDIDPDELAVELSHSRHTRFPIFEDDVDHIVGTLHLKDFARHRLMPAQSTDLRALVRPARLVPEHMPVEQLLETFRSERSHMAIVLDEFGGTAGLVTLEDLLEEIVGEVRDEFDVEKAPLEPVRPGVLDVEGEFQLIDLNDFMPLPEDRPDVDTVGGLVVTLLGRPAEPGDSVALGDATFTVLAVDGLAVARVRVAAGDAPGA